MSTQTHNLLDEIKQILYVNEVHPQFLELSSLAILSTAVGDKIFTETEYGKLYTQLMFLMISPSGIGKKTVILDKAEEIILMLENRHNKAILEKYGYPNKEAYLEDKDNLKDMNKEDAKKLSKKLRKIEKETVSYLAPDSFTSEALITYLTKSPIGLMKADEFSMMYKGSQNKAYMSNVFEILSKVYDGKMPNVATIKRGIEKVDRVNVSLICGTTPYFLHLLSDEFFMQGIGNRLCWILEVHKEKTDEVKQANYLFDQIKSEDKERARERIIEKLYTISQIDRRFVSFDTESAFKVIFEKVEKDNTAIDIFNDSFTDVKASYIVRMMQNVIKISLLHYIGRISVEQDEPTNQEIDIEDVNYALSIVENSYADYKQMYNLYKKLRKSKNIKSYADEFETFIEILKEFGGSCSISDIRRKKGWTSEDISKIAGQLILDERIETVSKIGKNGRSYLYYKIVEQSIG